MNLYFIGRNLFKIRSVGIALCIFILYNEWLVFILLPFHWPTLKCGDVKRLFNVLLVADPQILGEINEPWIKRWDSDRYLSETFSAALYYTQPQLIIFLGDLMDEGSIADLQQYERSYKRFRKIFQLDYISKNHTIFIPGDNDIGGEDEEVTPTKLSRFKEHFGHVDVIDLSKIQIVHANKIEKKVSKVVPLISGGNRLRIVISHMPILGLPSSFAFEVLTNVHPHIIFSAHDHKSVHFAANMETLERTLIEPLESNSFANYNPTWRFQITDKIVNEILVPTCSYRMGVGNMGYGVALIDEKGTAMCYNVLWLPSRLMHIYAYIVIIFVIGVIGSCTMCANCCPVQRTRYQKIRVPEYEFSKVSKRNFLKRLHGF